MGTPFQDACSAASNAVDAVYGESWTYQPMVASDPNARPVVDPDRAVKTIVGTYIDPYARAASGPARNQGVKPERPGHASARPAIELALAQLPYAPCSGDRVTRLADGTRYHLAEVHPDGTGRASIDLNKL